MGECARRFYLRVQGETSTIQIRQSGVCAIVAKRSIDVQYRGMVQ